MDVIDNRKEGVLDKIRNNRTFKKIKGIKNLQFIVAIFIIAVGLLIYSSVASAKSNKGGSDSNVSTTMDTEEEKLSAILGGIEGAGRVETMITRSGNEIVGVLIVAQGADNISVRLRLLDAAATALGVSKKIINVYTKQ